MGKHVDFLTSGYVSMDHMVKIKSPARIGFTSLIANKTNMDIYYGGCSVNIAYALCRLGLSAMPILRVGDDYETNGFKAFLENGNVPTDAISMVHGERTSVCYLLQDNMGQHITLFYPGAMDGIHSKPLDDGLFEDAGMGVLTVGARCDNEEFFHKCKQHGVPLVFGMKGDMDAFPPDFLDELLHYCKIIFTNECERDSIEKIFGKDILTLFNEGNAEIIVTTLGRDGSRCYTKTPHGIEQVEIPICDCARVEDTTGSGDAFMAGFLYGYHNGLSTEQCAKLGTVLSSFIIEKEGCCTNAPTLPELEERLRRFEETLKEIRR